MALLPRARAWAKLGIVCASIILFLSPQVCVVASNVIVDDSDPAMHYMPTDNWFLNSECKTCALNYSLFNTSQIQQGTWHDATAPDHGTPVNMTFSFNGTALYLFCIMLNNITGVSTSTKGLYTFELDGQPAAAYMHVPDSTTDISYNVSVFSVSDLEHTQHEVVMSVEPGAIALFDYAIYTQDEGKASPSSDSTSASSSSSNSLSPSHSSTPIYTPGQAVQTPLGPIVGGIVGGLAAVFLPLAVCWYRRRHRRPGLIVKKRRQGEPIIPSVDADAEPQPPSAYVKELETEVQLLRATVSPPAYMDDTSPAESTPAAVDAPAYDEAGGSRHDAGGPLAERSVPPSRPGKRAQKLLWKSEKPGRNLQH